MKRLLLTLLIVLLVSLNSFAQGDKSTQTGGPTVLLTGTVYDVTKAVIVGAKVVARGPRGKLHETSTGDDGTYVLWLPPGVYQVEAGALHFCPSRVDRFKVVNSTHGKMSLDFILEVQATHTPCERKPPAGKAPRGKARKRSAAIIE